eukprot:12366833-Karenia_brevis.AAC.1
MTKLAEIHSCPYCLMFDGGVFSCRPAYQILAIRDQLAAIERETGLEVSIKPWEGHNLPAFAALPAELVRQGKMDLAAHPMLAVGGNPNSCLLYTSPSPRDTERS